jgi:Ca-activated chloride channel family protein
MAEFHFLRPVWLLLAPVGAWLIWQLLRGRADGGGWRSVVEPSLRPYVLAEPEVLRDSRLALVAALAAWLLGVVALAGPAWERLPVPAFRSDEALVVALDLSRSMDAGDVEPSRLARAKLKLLDLLERRAAGQTALVVFSTHAFTVTPLTTDTRTISSLVTAVDTNIMPTQGGSIAAGLTKAAMLLEQTGLSSGDILLITDSEVDAADLDLAGELAGDGYRVSVLAVGTDQGAPIPRAEGGFVTDSNGQVVIPQLDASSLQRLVAAGGGRFAALAPNDRDLDTLFPAALPLDVALDEAAGEQYEADVWLDRGLVLAVVLLPLLALSFRRGWICGFALVALAPLPRAHAFEWQDLWQRPDQRGLEALEAQQAEQAAQLFENPEWRSAAQYRAGQFEESAVTLANVESAASHYNRGNALAKAGQLPAAIAAYDRALELDPGNEDARYNRELVEEFLRNNPEQQQQPQEQSQGEQGQQGDSDQAQSQSGEQQDGSESGDEQSEQGEQGESGESQANDGAETQPEEPNDGEPTPEEEGAEQNANAGEEAEEEALANAAAGPEEVEQWASEQAAEQWLRRVQQDPGGLLRRKFLYQYQRSGLDQDGNRVTEGAAAEQRPW